MDMITLAMAKVYSDSKGGYVGKGTIISGELTDGTYQDFTTKLEAGKKYTLKLDSGIYSGVAIDYGNTGDLFYIGNLAIMGEEFADVNTGESYCVGYMSLDNVFAVTDSNNSKTFSLEGETIVPIDPKYLPGVCLPVVELETAVTSTPAALSEEDGAQMDTLNGEPAVLKLVAIVNGAEWALRGIAACTNVDGILVYSITSYVEGTLLVSLMNAGNGWVAACNYG